MDLLCGRSGTVHKVLERSRSHRGGQDPVCIYHYFYFCSSCSSTGKLEGKILLVVVCLFVCFFFLKQKHQFVTIEIRECVFVLVFLNCFILLHGEEVVE